MKYEKKKYKCIFIYLFLINIIFKVLYGFMQLAGSIGLTLTVRKLGKRMLTLSTLATNTLAIFLFAVYFICIKNKLISSEAYIPMILYSIIMFSGAMGMLTVPWTLVSEIYPNE